MKKQIISALLAFALLVQVFTVPALAAITGEITYDRADQTIAVAAEGVEGDRASLVVLINEQLDLGDGTSFSGLFSDQLDYINQLVAVDGEVAQEAYPSRVYFYGDDVIYAYVNGVEISQEVARVDIGAISIDGTGRNAINAGGTSHDLQLVFEPAFADVASVVWSSSNEGIATVEGGEVSFANGVVVYDAATVTCVKAGLVTITATVTDVNGNVATVRASIRFA